MNFRSKNTKSGLMLLIGSAVMLSAWNVDAAQKPEAPQKDAAAEAAIPYKELPDTATAAEVNGVKITMKDINNAISAIKKSRPKLADDSEKANSILSIFRKGMLRDLIDFQVLLQEAKKRNITIDPKKVDAMIWQTRAKFPTEADYQAWLTKSGQTEAELHEDIKQNMMVDELGMQIGVDVTVSDADLKKFYEANKSQFVIPDAVLVSHILIAVKPDATEAEKEELKKKAQKILKQAQSSKSDFAELALANSDDKATASKAGNLGYLVEIDKGSWKPLVDAAFSATPGKVISHLVETDFGFHIVKPIEKKTGRTLTLNEVRDSIRPMVLNHEVQMRVQDEVKKLRAAATIKTYI